MKWGCSGLIFIFTQSPNSHHLKPPKHLSIYNEKSKKWTSNGHRNINSMSGPSFLHSLAWLTLQNLKVLCANLRLQEKL